MRLALLSDVHGNFEALQETLRHVARRASDALLVCAGDMMGYGPDPEPCLDLLAGREAVMVLGNHEQMILGRLGFERCVPAGIVSALWTREQLSTEATELIARLPIWADAGSDAVVCHGDLDDVETYVGTSERAHEALEKLRVRRPTARVLVCGHTHRPTFYSSEIGLVHPTPGTTLSLPREPCLINPGSVGQERIGRNPIARYALIDLDRRVATYEALEYDHAKTIRKERAAKLPVTVVLLPKGRVRRGIERVLTLWSRRRAARTPGNPTRISQRAYRDRSVAVLSKP